VTATQPAPLPWPPRMALAAGSTAVLSQSRAHYWLARAIAAAGGDATAEYTAACVWPTTFYGQLACIALKQDPAARIRALRDPAATRAEVLDLTAREVVRAAVLLVAWGEPRRAHAFILRMDALAPSPGDRVLTARLALALGMPDMAVFIARRIGQHQSIPPHAGWPLAFDPPAGVVDPALALGVMRQESSFDVAAVSPSGARGLMQLMPATAQVVAQQIGDPVKLASLTVDPTINMRLGTAYLHGLLEQFANSVPLAVAAYNAGPSRVDQWLAANGDPRVAPAGGAASPGGTVGAPDMVDWIELIPFGETRNYVQRVLENTEVYRAKLNEAATSQFAQGAD
jgi:soluble lytic murein transglycosylase